MDGLTQVEKIEPVGDVMDPKGSQLVLSGQAATLKHSILINFELFDRGNRRNGRFQ